MPSLSAPIFDFRDSEPLSVNDSHLRSEPPQGTYVLAGPGATAEAGHLPVRGDLAHIKLAGRYFVPHYAVPMPHIAGTAGAAVHQAASLEARIVHRLAAGETFDVLDIAGGWAWGQAGEDGFVGYVALEELERPTT